MNKRIKTIACFLLIGIGLIGCGGGNDIPDPEISGIQPESGPPGTAVTIFGQGFSPEISENQVTFAGTVAEITNATETEINTEVPEDAETGPIAVTVLDVTATGPNFTVEPEAPGISSVDPDSGTVGTEVTIKGMNFSPTTTDNTITFNGTEAPIRGAAADQLITEVPTGATDGPIEVIVHGKTATGPDFDVITDGTLRALIATNGPDRDEDGYTLSVSGIGDFSTDTTDTVYVGDLQEDTYDAELTGVAGNCTVESDNPQMFDITPGDTTSVSFEVSCDAVLKNRVVFVSDRGTGGQIDLYTMIPDGSEVNQITDNSASERFPDISPDGTEIVYSQDQNIWVVNADGTNPVQLTTSGQDFSPVWSPDGSQIMYTSNSDGDGEIMVMDADGSAQTKITDNSDVDFGSSWSPDGTQIVFSSDRDGDPEIFVSNADGSSPQKLTDNSDFDVGPTWSPEGSKIGFYTNRSGDYQVYSMDTDGNNQQMLADASSFDSFVLSWSPDGSQIVFHTDKDGNFEIYLVNDDGSSETNLTMNTATDLEPDWSPVN